MSFLTLARWGRKTGAAPGLIDSFLNVMGFVLEQGQELTFQVTRGQYPGFPLIIGSGSS